MAVCWDDPPGNAALGHGEKGWRGGEVVSHPKSLIWQLNPHKCVSASRGCGTGTDGPVYEELLPLISGVHIAKAELELLIRVNGGASVHMGWESW